MTFEIMEIRSVPRSTQRQKRNWNYKFAIKTAIFNFGLWQRIPNE